MGLEGAGDRGERDVPHARSRAPHLVVSAGKPEKEWGELYDGAGGDRSEPWHLPKASHTAALRQYPDAYEKRVVSFFDANLLTAR